MVSGITVIIFYSEGSEFIIFKNDVCVYKAEKS